jgi:Fe-Mn family superoxide dismutase
MAHELAPLPYAYDALEPFIDTMTVQIHHGKHHATYVSNLNAAIEKFPALQAKTVDDVLRELASVPEAIRTAVRNNGGGVANHNMFWSIMAPKSGGEPSGPLADAIKAAFGTFESFKAEFKKASLGRFGSGWAWLINAGGTVTIESTANQDSPLSEGKNPILLLDVWEHAYYLKYQNRRADYVDAWWSVVNWTEVGKRFANSK